MYFVYYLRSEIDPKQTYVGFTNNFCKRLEYHNLGKSFHTNKFKPWEPIIVIKFFNEDKARKFEKYLKTGSGRAFLKKHF